MPAGRQSFLKTYDFGDFTEVETDVGSTQFTVTHELEVQEGQAESLGRGQDRTQTDAVGRLLADIENTGDSDMSGQIRFSVRTLQGRLVAVISEFALDEVRSGANDRTNRYPFPVQRFETSGGMNRWIARGYKLCVELQTSSGTATVSTSNSTLKADGNRAEKTA